MSGARLWFLLAAFAVIGLLVVHLRAEQTRYAAQCVALESQRMALRRELWDLQVRNARLRAPGQIHDRVKALHAGVVPPGSDEIPQPPVRLAWVQEE